MSYFAADMRRIFHSKSFAVAILSFVFVRFYVCLPEILQSMRISRDLVSSHGYLYFLWLAMLGPLRQLSLIIAAAPFSFSYQSDIDSGAATYLIQRKSFDRFLFYRFLSCLTSSFLVSFFGNFLVAVILIGLCRGHAGSLPLDASTPLLVLSQSKPLMFILLASVNISLFVVAWSSFALLLSSLTRNAYVSFVGLVVGSDLIGWIVLNRLVSFPEFTWNGMYYGLAKLGDIWSTESVIVLLYLAIASFWGVLFISVNKRRYKYAAL